MTVGLEIAVTVLGCKYFFRLVDIDPKVDQESPATEDTNRLTGTNSDDDHRTQPQVFSVADSTSVTIISSIEYEKQKSSQLQADQAHAEQAEVERNDSSAALEAIGGLAGEIKSVREMVELPLTSPHLFERFGVPPYISTDTEYTWL